MEGWPYSQRRAAGRCFGVSRTGAMGVPHGTPAPAYRLVGRSRLAPCPLAPRIGPLSPPGCGAALCHSEGSPSRASIAIRGTLWPWPIAVTFRYILYTRMNMNRNPRNPLKTNDPCTLYSIKIRVFLTAPPQVRRRTRRRIPPAIAPFYSTHLPGGTSRNSLRTQDGAHVYSTQNSSLPPCGNLTRSWVLSKMDRHESQTTSLPRRSQPGEGGSRVTELENV
jgi:hypothetical protein